MMTNPWAVRARLASTESSAPTQIIVPRPRRLVGFFGPDSSPGPPTMIQVGIVTCSQIGAARIQHAVNAPDLLSLDGGVARAFYGSIAAVPVIGLLVNL